MKIFKTEITFKDIAESILSIFSISVIVTLFVGIYLLGLMHGFVAGRKASQEAIFAVLNEREAVMTPTPSISPTPQPRISAPPQNVRINWSGPELWEAVNARRSGLGVNPLQQRDELCTIASIRLNELLELGKLDGHEGFSNMPERRPDLKWIFEKYSSLAEFLAVGGDTPEETVALWENTLGHRKLLEGGEFVWGCIYAQNTFAVAITAY